MDSIGAIGSPGKPVRININRIYPTIQGEGLNSGLPVALVRFQGCNLSCRFCDAFDAQGQKKAAPMSASEIVDEIKYFNMRNILITGGEPFTQPAGLLGLLYAIRGSISAAMIFIETNGTVLTPLLGIISRMVNHITISPKREMLPLPEYLELADEVRCPIDKAEDFLIFHNFLNEQGYFGPRLVSPVTGIGRPLEKQAEECLDWILGNPSANYRLSLQIHKILEIE